MHLRRLWEENKRAGWFEGDQNKEKVWLNEERDEKLETKTWTIELL